MNAIPEGEAYYRLLFDVTPLPVFVFDLESYAILDVNQAALETYGYTRAEFLTLTMAALLTPADFAYLKEHLEAQPTIHREKEIWQHVRKNGASFTVEVNAHTVNLGARRVRLLLANDISERLRQEQRLQANERQYRELYEKANDAIYTHDLQGNLTSMNEAGLHILGFSHEELVGLNMAVLLPPEDFVRATEMIRQKFSGDLQNSVYEVRVITRDGQHLPVELNTTLMWKDGQPIGVQGIARLLTERKQVEEQLRQAQKMEAVGRLVGGMAHDFNNRLTAIQGFTDLLLKRIGQDEQQVYYLDQLKIASERAAELTRQLLNFSRKQLLHPKILNLNEVVSDWGNLVRVLLGENIAVHLILGSDIGLVQADPTQLEHLMMNLALNACDAMPSGGDFTIETTDLEISELQAQFNPAIPPGEYVRLLIKDNGCGMSEETRLRLFEPFFTTKERGKGTGLGLFTAYGIIKQSGGSMEVKSTPGEGTTFLIYLPVVADAQVPAATRPALPQAATGGGTILVVEDEPIVRMLVCTVLTEAGYQVLEAAHGTEALTIVAQHSGTIDLLLTDVRMPGLDGCDLAAKINQLRGNTRVLFISAYTDESRALQASGPAISAFMQKPFTPAALTATVRRLLDCAADTVAATA